MASSLGPGSAHQVRSKSRIARSRSESAIPGSLPSPTWGIKHPPSASDPYAVRYRPSSSTGKSTRLVSGRSRVRVSPRAQGNSPRFGFSTVIPRRYPQPVDRWRGIRPEVLSHQKCFGLHLGRVALGQVDLELALDALEGVVDRLHVAAQLLTDLLVGAALHVEAEDVDLEAGQQVGHRVPHGTHALAGNDLLGRVGDVVVVEELLDAALAGIVAAPHARDRHVLVEGLVLLAGGRLDGGDDLAGDAQFGEGPERGLPVVAEVTHGLVQADHALLLDVVEVGADEEVAAGLGADEAPGAREEGVESLHGAGAVAGDKGVVAEFGGRVQAERHSYSCGCVGGVRTGSLVVRIPAFQGPVRCNH